MSKPLDGIRVLEVAMYGFVPSAGAVLAEWGADPGILGRLGAQAWLDLSPDRPV